MQDATITFLDQVVSDLEAVTGRVRRDTEAVLLLTDPIELVKHYDQVRIVMERVKIARNALEEIKDNLSIEQIPTLFMNRSVKTLNVEGVGRVTVSYRWSASIINKEAGYDWLRNNGAESLITETVNSSSLSAFAKERVQEDKELPPDIFKVGTQPYTSITKG